MILFLDFDGVLHPDAAYLEKGRPVLRAMGELFMWAPALIEALAPYPQIKIVLSTSWVRVRGFERARDALPEALRRRVIGATWHSAMIRSTHNGLKLPSCWWDEASRYQQIARYAERAGIKRWIAVDDHGEEWAAEDRSKLILTNPDRGIADPLALDELLLAIES